MSYTAESYRNCFNYRLMWTQHTTEYKINTNELSINFEISK